MAKRSPSSGGVSKSESDKQFTLPPGRLWPNTPHGGVMELEIIGSTGEYRSGKTFFGLTIAPGNHADGPFAGQPRTLYIDLEKSGASYTGPGCRRIDLYDLMTEKFTGKDGKVAEYTPEDVLRTLFDYLEKNVQQHQYSVIAIDPITDIEDAITQRVRNHPEKFGLTSDQVKKGGGLLWGAVKAYYKTSLLRLVASRCKTFYFTAHMRDEFSGAIPTGRREPKGKETLFELASLYVQFKRDVIADGPHKGELPVVPTAVILKERVLDNWIDENGDLQAVPLLPPVITECTVRRLRGYIACGYDVAAPSESEKFFTPEPTESELLRMRTQAAEKEADANTSKLELMRRQAELKALAAQPVNPQAERVQAEQAKPAARAEESRKEAVEEKKQAKTATAETVVSQTEAPKNEPSTAATATQSTRAPIELLRELKDCITKAGVTPDQLGKALTKMGVKEPKELSAEQAQTMIDSLKKRIAS